MPDNEPTIVAKLFSALEERSQANRDNTALSVAALDRAVLALVDATEALASTNATAQARAQLEARIVAVEKFQLDRESQAQSARVHWGPILAAAIAAGVVSLALWLITIISAKP